MYFDVGSNSPLRFTRGILAMDRELPTHGPTYELYAEASLFGRLATEIDNSAFGIYGFDRVLR